MNITVEWDAMLMIDYSDLPSNQNDNNNNNNNNQYHLRQKENAVYLLYVKDYFYMEDLLKTHPHQRINDTLNIINFKRKNGG